LSQNRWQRFRDSDVHQKWFDEIVEPAMKRGLGSGEVLHVDATHPEGEPPTRTSST
jgi:hypothetical protein